MKNKEKNFASAVIYVRNAEARIYRFLNAIIHVMEENFEHSEIICINDASEDGSLNAIKSLSKEASRTSLSVVNMSYFHGLERSMNTGVDLSIGDFVFEFDNTFLDFDIDEIMNVYYKSLEGYDIVVASPDRKMKFTARYFYKLFNYFGSLQSEVRPESFRVLSRRLINRINSINKTIYYRKAIYSNSGLKSTTLVYKPINQDINENHTRKERNFKFDLAIDSLIVFTRVGFSFSIFMTFLMMSILLISLIFSFICRFSDATMVGWPPIITFLSVCFFGLFGILAIVIKYLQLLVDLVIKRSNYNFNSVEKLTK